MIITTHIKNIKEYDDSWFEYTLSTLPSWRREKTDKLKHERSRKTSILAGKMILDIFNEYDVDPDNVILSSAGKPVIPGEEVPFFFSISHSEDVVAISVSNPNDLSSTLPGGNKIDAEVVFAAAAIPPRSKLKSSRGLSIPSIGVDIEKVRLYDRKLADRFFTDEETDYIEHTEDKDEAFTRIWTSKESYGKFVGGGLNDGLNFSIFHNPLIPLDVILPCFFEHGEKDFGGDRYIYTVCYGVIEKEPQE